MGTPEFAVPSLEALCTAPDFEVALAVTQPDRVRGRGSRPVPAPVKQAAEAQRVPLVAPASACDPALIAQLASLRPDLIAVVAYGEKIPSAILALPRLAIVNLHASLLPAYRGAAPIQRALWDGRTETGNTIQHVSAGWDQGDIIVQQVEPILPEDTYDSLSRRLAACGALLLLQALCQLIAGTAARTPQDHARATYAPKITPAELWLDFAQPAARLHNQVRALSARPGARALFRGKLLRVLQTRPLDLPGTDAPGTLRVTRHSALVHTAQGQLELLRVQLEGGAEQTAQDFINGRRPTTGERLERPDSNVRS